jgi:hypothetical protein
MQKTFHECVVFFPAMERSTVFKIIKVPGKTNLRSRMVVISSTASVI